MGFNIEITLRRDEHPPKTGLLHTVIKLPTGLEIHQDRNGNIITIEAKSKWSMPWFYSIAQTYASDLFTANRRYDRRRVISSLK